MLYDKIIKSEDVVLRTLELSDCKQYYLDWLNDKNINQYLETRWSEQTLESIRVFVKSIRESTHSYLFAILYENRHVGNIKIGPIHPIYKFADISYFIGDRSVWNKGIATKAIRLIVKFGFEELNLNRIEAGAFEQNIGSQKALLKNGFIREAIYRKKFFLENSDEYCDIYHYAILKEDWQK